MKLNLSKKEYINEGNVRECYAHPLDADKIIKIHKTKLSSNKQQNEIESIYYNDLKKEKVPFTHIAICYGWIQTNKGKGLMFEKIHNYDNTKVVSLEDAIIHKLLSESDQLKLIHNLKEYILNYNILFVDVGLSNILCKKINKSDYILIIIDGLGARRLNIKFWLHRKILFLKKRKIKKQWKKFMNNYDSLKKQSDKFDETI